MQDFSEKGPSEREIRETLENFEAPFDPESWVILEQKINAKYTEETPEAVAEVDKIVYPKIAKFEADFSSKHWAIMADRLQLIAVRKRQVWSSKLIETAIFLLLLIQLPTWLGLAPEPKKRLLMPKNQAVAGLEEPSNRHEKSVPNSFSGGSKNHFSNAEKETTANAFLQNLGISSEVADGILNAASSLFSFQNEGVFKGPIAFFSNPFLNENQGEKEAENASKNDLEKVAFENQNGARPPFDFQAQVVDNEQVMIEKELNQVALFAPFLSRHPNQIASQKGPFLPIDFVAEKTKKRRWKLAAFASPQLNYVETISTSNDKIQNYQQLAQGYGGGISFGSKKGRWGVETGLVYQAKNFDQSTELVTGNFEKYLVSKIEKVEFEEVAVPLHLTCQIGRLKKTKITAVAGNSLQLVAQKNIIRSAKTDDPRGILASAALRDSKQNSGLFEGGRFEKNAFVTADLGLRFERPLGSSRFAFFIEPMMQTPLGTEGLGDQKAKFTSFSLRTGVVSTL